MSAETPRFKQELYTPEQVDVRIEEMAGQLLEMYKGKKVLFVQLLGGSQPFATKLMFALAKLDPDFQPNLQAMIISRYGESREAAEMKLVADLPEKYRDLAGYDVVLLDDLIDEGLTLEFARQILLDHGAESVENVVLVKKEKTTAQVVGSVALYGFTAPDEWLVGMGMDDPRVGAEGERWYAGIAIANDEVSNET